MSAFLNPSSQQVVAFGGFDEDGVVDDPASNKNILSVTHTIGSGQYIVDFTASFFNNINGFTVLACLSTTTSGAAPFSVRSGVHILTPGTRAAARVFIFAADGTTFVDHSFNIYAVAL